MALIVPNGPAFAHWSDNLTASADGLDYGTGVPPGASANTVGDPVTVLNDLTHDCEFLTFSVCNSASLAGSGHQNSALLDILVDPAGGTDWSVLVAGLLCGWSQNVDIDGASVVGTPAAYFFPLWIPAGTAIGARIQGDWRNLAATYSPPTPRLVMWAAGGNKNPASWWCGQKVETVGTFDTANSLGQLHTPGASGAFSSWESLGSPAGARVGAIQSAAGGPDATSVSGKVYRFEFGAGSNQVGPCCYRGLSGTEFATAFYPGPVFCDIPAATQMQVRAACGAASPQAIDCAAYLVQ